MNFNFKKIFTFIFSGFAVFALSAQELLRNGSFEDGLSHWKIAGEYSLDSGDKTTGKQSLKITKGYFDQIWQFAEVKPNTEYELTYYLKCTDLKCGEKKASSALRFPLRETRIGKSMDGTGYGNLITGPLTGLLSRSVSTHRNSAILPN